MKETDKNKVDLETGENDVPNANELKAEGFSEESSQNAPVQNDKISEKSEGEETPKKKNRIPLYIGAVVLLIAAIGGFFYWLHARQFESTDDAFIEGDVVQISPKVSAYVAKVHVKENQQIHKGDLLVELDTRDYEARLEQSKAQLRAAQAQRNQSQAGVDLTRKTVQASQNQAHSNVESARTNVEQTRAAAEAKRTAINQAQSQVKTAQANLAQTRAQIPQEEANLNLAQTQVNRYQNLFRTGDISRQQVDQAVAALRVAQSQLDAARRQVDAAQSRVNEANAGVATAQENYRQSVAQIALTQSQVNESTGRLQDAEAAPERISVSESQIGTAEASIAQAEAAVHQAELELSYTKIFAPEDGFVTRKAVQEGQLVQPGAPLMALSQSDEIWVVANFKETQLNLMRVGQPVDIEVDAYPNQDFHGHIDSFQLGTGSRFSVLPAENASGNYVKVVQRIPVRIVLDETPDNVHLLAPGMSVEPSVKVR
jgi:membrane fusion protein (multidrug efflux system)